jgi:hypothetical protein
VSRTLFFLLLWSVIPGTIMVISCLYMCICSKFIFIGDDGHMRIFCCGRAVTGESVERNVVSSLHWLGLAITEL